MTGKHSHGYLAAYAAATREAARRFREDNPDEWAHILQRQQQARADKRATRSDISDLVGSVPDFTGDLSTEEYVRSIRDW